MLVHTKTSNTFLPAARASHWAVAIVRRLTTTMVTTITIAVSFNTFGDHVRLVPLFAVVAPGNALVVVVGLV